MDSDALLGHTVKSNHRGKTKAGFSSNQIGERIGYLALVEIEQLLDSRDQREEGVRQGDDPPESLEGHLIKGNGLHGC